MPRDPKPLQGPERGWGNSPRPLGWGHWGLTRTGGGHQISVAATRAGAWGPLRPFATCSPPQGLGPAFLTYFGPAGDKGVLCSSAQAEKGLEAGGETRTSPGLWDPGLVGPPSLRPWPPLPLFPWEPAGSGLLPRTGGTFPSALPGRRRDALPLGVLRPPRRWVSSTPLLGAVRRGGVGASICAARGAARPVPSGRWARGRNEAGLRPGRGRSGIGSGTDTEPGGPGRRAMRAG